MAVEKQYYLSCSQCGKQFISEFDGAQYGETGEEIRELALEEGWHCYMGSMNEDDYCKQCLTTKGITLELN